MSKKKPKPKVVEAEAPEAIAKTYAELAQALGMTGTDPERVLQRWARKQGFPGRPSDQGRANGQLPVEKIREFMRSHGYQGSAVSDEELRDARRIKELIELELRERSMAESLGRLVDVDEVGGFMAQVISNAKAILGGIVDRVIEGWPDGVDESMRAEARRVFDAELETAYGELARICSGDDDADDNRSGRPTVAQDGGGGVGTTACAPA